MDHTETGIAVVALSVVFIALKLVERYVFDRRNGNGNGHGIKQLVCPNRIDGLSEVMHSIEETIKVNSEVAKAVHSGVSRLVEQHAPSDGVEQWKIQPHTLVLLEDLKKKQQQMLAMQSRVVSATERMVELQQETVIILRSNGKNKSG